MAKVNFGSAENLIRIGLLLSFVAITLMSKLVHVVTANMFFWMILIILFIETFKLPSISALNALVAEMILTLAMAITGIKILISSFGRNFTEHHTILIVFILGTLIMLFGLYKKLPAAAKSKS